MLIDRYKTIKGNKKIVVNCIMLLVICITFSLIIGIVLQIILKNKFTDSDFNVRYQNKVENEICSAVVGGKISADAFGKSELNNIAKKYSDIGIEVYTRQTQDDEWQIFYRNGKIGLSDNIGTRYYSFADGTQCMTTVYVFEARKQRIIIYKNIIVGICGFVSYIVVVVIYLFRIQKKLSRLRKEMEYIEGGDMSRRIMNYGDVDVDEIAKSIGRLKDNMLESHSNEIKAIEDRDSMARYLAHDIRTPLTVISGNLELIQLGLENGTDKEKINSSISVCMEKIEQIKDLTENVFIDDTKKEITIGTIKDNYIDNCIMELENSGFKVSYNCIYDKRKQCTIVIKNNLLKRVINNMASNILKYADTSMPVIITVADTSVVIKNSYKITDNYTESNYMGTSICEELMSQMEGTYSRWTDNNEYYQKIVFKSISS